MNKIVCFSFLLIIGCVDYLPTEKDKKDSENNIDNTVSICYNIDSIEHGNICTESCLELGNQTTFCWNLYREDCRPPLLEEWQKQSCHFFN